MADSGKHLGIEVVDVPGQQRYEVRLRGRQVGFAAYLRSDELIVFTHTEVEPGHDGEGIGSTLVRAALDDVRRQGLSVLALCPFVRGWLQRHPDYADLDYRQPPSTVTD